MGKKPIYVCARASCVHGSNSPCSAPACDAYHRAGSHARSCPLFCRLATDHVGVERTATLERIQRIHHLQTSPMAPTTLQNRTPLEPRKILPKRRQRQRRRNTTLHSTRKQSSKNTNFPNKIPRALARGHSF